MTAFQQSNVCLMLLFVLTGWACGWERNHPAFRLSSDSPHKVYQLQLREELEDNGKHRVVMSLKKNGAVKFADEPLYGGSKWDARFERLFPEHNWVMESVVHFGHKTSTPPERNDVIDITNNSKNSVSYLSVLTGSQDSFLLFDLEPGATVHVSAEPQTDRKADFSEFTYWAKLNDGTVRGNSAFNIRGKYTGPSHYVVSVTDAGVFISSNEFQPMDKGK
ncbi:MAG TPA: hypothetical protein VGN86_06445 [Pyrinomonadaceae bacterium]|nr:hypothetical protein [Pyrinomonadaceae bacterium]